jgi:hypothetical protein
MARRKVWNDFWTQAEVARTLHVSRARVHQMLEEGKLATVVRGPRRYVSGASLYNYMLANKLLQLELFEKGGGGGIDG